MRKSVAVRPRLSGMPGRRDRRGRCRSRARRLFVEDLGLAGLGLVGTIPKRPADLVSSLVPAEALHIRRSRSSSDESAAGTPQYEAGRSVEMIWLLGRLVPDHETIPTAARTMAVPSVEFVLILIALSRAMDLQTQAGVAIDGRRFKAVKTAARTSRAPIWSGA